MTLPWLVAYVGFDVIVRNNTVTLPQ